MWLRIFVLKVKGALVENKSSTIGRDSWISISYLIQLTGVGLGYMIVFHIWSSFLKLSQLTLLLHAWLCSFIHTTCVNDFSAPLSALAGSLNPSISLLLIACNSQSILVRFSIFIPINYLPCYNFFEDIIFC